MGSWVKVTLGWGWLSYFMLKCQDFKCSLYGLSVRDALAKTESKSKSKTRFYVWKRENAFFCCTGEVTRPCQGLLWGATWPPLLMTQPCQFCSTPKPRFFVFHVLLSMSMDSKHLTLFNQCIIKLLRVSLLDSALVYNWFSFMLG